MRLIIFSILLSACGEPVDWIGLAPPDGSGPLDPPPTPAVFLCCGAGDVECAQGECTPAGYCPILCAPDDPNACGDPDWAVCMSVPAYASPICVAVEQVCDPVET